MRQPRWLLRQFCHDTRVTWLTVCAVQLIFCSSCNLNNSFTFAIEGAALYIGRT